MGFHCGLAERIEVAACAHAVTGTAVAFIVNVESVRPGARPVMRAVTTTLSPFWTKLTVPAAAFPFVASRSRLRPKRKTRSMRNRRRP